MVRWCHCRTIERDIANSRANSATVNLWRTIHVICFCLNCVVKMRRPSKSRRCVSIRRLSIEKSVYPSQTALSNWGTELFDPTFKRVFHT